MQKRQAGSCPTKSRMRVIRLRQLPWLLLRPLRSLCSAALAATAEKAAARETLISMSRTSRNFRNYPAWVQSPRKASSTCGRRAAVFTASRTCSPSAASAREARRVAAVRYRFRAACPRHPAEDAVLLQRSSWRWGSSGTAQPVKLRACKSQSPQAEACAS